MATTSFGTSQASLSPLVRTRREIVFSPPLRNYATFESVQRDPVRLSASCRTRTPAHVGGQKVVNNRHVHSSDDDDEEEISSGDGVDENEVFVLSHLLDFGL